MINDLLGCLPRDRLAANRAVRFADTCIQQTKVVIDLSDRPYRRAWIARRGLLINGHCRREAFDEVNIRLIHLAEELTGVGREALNVASLAFGEDRVECQAGLA